MLRRAWLACLALCLAAPCVAAGGEERRVVNAAEFHAAVRSAQPGDTIVMANGAWRDAELLFDAAGTPDAVIRLRAETPGGVLMCGKSRLRIGGCWLEVAGLHFADGQHPVAAVEFRRDSRQPAHHCRLTQTAIVDYNPPSPDSECKWISVYGTHNRVDHCYLAGKNNGGATLVVWLDGEPNNHRIDHNHFGARRRLGRNGGETIRVGDSRTSLSNSRTLVEHNLFHRCDGEAEIISNKSCENVYRYNTFRDCSGALTLRHGNRCLVEGNYFLSSLSRGTGGVRIIGEDHRVVNNYFGELAGEDSRAAISMMNGLPDSPLEGYFQVKRAIVAFNTFFGCKQTFVIGLADKDQPRQQLPPLDCVIANNLVVSRHGPLIVEHTPSDDITWQGNLYSGAEIGLPVGAGMREAELPPLPAAGPMWRPRPDADHRGAAVGDFDWVTEDIDGHVRTDPKDVGCDQWSELPPRRGALRAEDVGPDWMRQKASP